MFNLFLKLFKPSIITWLRTRVLVLPQAKVDSIAKKLKVSPEIVRLLNAEVIEAAVQAI